MTSVDVTGCVRGLRLGAVPPLLRPARVLERMVWSIALQGRLSAPAREALP